MTLSARYKQLLSGTTMYRLLQWYLRVVVAVALALAAANQLPFGVIELAIHVLVLVGACWGWNQLFARLFAVATNEESQYITGLILSLLFVPASPTPQQLAFLLGLAGVAMASKYLITWRHRHLFNPTALAAVVSAIALGRYAAWWVAAPVLLPVVALGGLILIQKLRRWQLVGGFLGVYLGAVFGVALAQGADLADAASLLRGLLTQSPILFFTFVMLPEPLTSPTTTRGLVSYGVIVAVTLISLQFGAPSVAYALEASLLVGNLVGRLFFQVTTATLSFIRRQHLAEAIDGLWFDATPPPIFEAGQFMELTLPHKASDSRGVRRFFTIASAPSESPLMLAAKFPDPMSSYKQALTELKPGDHAYVSQIGGSFTLPADPTLPILMVAGGIGITPFRSMLAELKARRQSRPITLLYAAKHPDEFVFDELLDWADGQGMRVIRVVSDPPKGWNGKRGRIDRAMVERLVPDVRQRLVYLSGPEPMVEAFQELFRGLGVPRTRIKRDFFPGYTD